MPIPPFAVPTITSDEEVKELAKNFRPVKIKDGNAFLIKTPKDLFAVSFLWDAKLTPYKGDLFVLDRFFTVHEFGYQGTFKPSVAEVLCQVPKVYSKLKVCYFETVGPEDAHDLNMWIEHMNAGVHVARTTLMLPAPTLQTMSEYYENHPELAYARTQNASTDSAIRWLNAMKPEDRLKVFADYDQNTGKRKDGIDNNTIVTDKKK